MESGDATAAMMKPPNPFNLVKQPKLPLAFTWPAEDRCAAAGNLDFPVVDLSGFFDGNDDDANRVAKLAGAACREHGFFQVINHGVDAEVYAAAMSAFDGLFGLPFDKKVEAGQRKRGMEGYAIGHSDRFSTKLPWKETFTFVHGFKGEDHGSVERSFEAALGPDLQRTGKIYQRYCEAMEELSLVIAELIGMSLGGDRKWYREFFEDGKATARCNYYPPCSEAELTLGTGPHADPNAFTILQQDEEVSGLDVFAGGHWNSVRPVAGALVVNIGDTFEALSNGEYKSCLHRAVVNPYKERRSIAYFVSPRNDRIIRPPPELISGGGDGDGDKRKYPDFTWLQLLEFIQNRYRVDGDTLSAFIDYHRSSPAAN